MRKVFLAGIFWMLVLLGCGSSPTSPPVDNSTHYNTLIVSNDFKWVSSYFGTRTYTFKVYLDGSVIMTLPYGQRSSYSQVTQGNHVVSCYATDNSFSPAEVFQATQGWNFPGTGATLSLSIDGNGTEFPEFIQE